VKTLKTVNIDEWLQKNISDMKVFKEYWIEQNQDNSEIFPNVMHEGDWDEQFHFFCDKYFVSRINIENP
jgi:hypothetical protein